MRRLSICSGIAVTSFLVIILIYNYNIHEYFLINPIQGDKLNQRKTNGKQTDIKGGNSTSSEYENIKPNITNLKIYTILFWDSLPNWLGTNDLISRCAYNSCHISTDKKDFNKSDAVIMYGPAHYNKRVPEKRNKQVWIFMSMESQLNLYNSFRHLNDMINWTWTYRRDSDIMGHYGVIKPIQKISRFEILPKNKSIAWFVSNCFDKSSRISYADMMKKYKPVDVYGRCGSLECSRENNTCRNMLRSEYNFYLSFENSICRDYITEKSLTRMRDQVIPIVRGGSNYTLYLPPHSYINTASYQTIKSLSDDISKIESDEKSYSRFHRWRQFYTNTEFKDVVDYEYGWCEICRRLHFQDKFKRLYGDFTSWWEGNAEIGKMCRSATDVH